MAAQDEATPRSVDMRLLLLCAAFTGWSLAGLPQAVMVWKDYVRWWWSLPLYVVGHLGLVVMIMRRTGLRLWSSLFCIAGLVIGERFVPLWLFALTIWTVRGFV